MGLLGVVSISHRSQGLRLFLPSKSCESPPPVLHVLVATCVSAYNFGRCCKSSVQFGLTGWSWVESVRSIGRGPRGVL